MGWGYIAVSIVIIAIVVSLFTALLCFGQMRDSLFRAQANRSSREHREPASGPLVGHMFRDPNYFWAPGTALGCYEGGGPPHNGPDTALAKVVDLRIKSLREADRENTDPIPYDLIAGPGCILDPYISPAAAEYQLRRVAKARGLDEQAVRVFVADATEGRLLGFLGEPRIDVLRLNLALDRARCSRSKSDS